MNSATADLPVRGLERPAQCFHQVVRRLDAVISYAHHASPRARSISAIKEIGRHRNPPLAGHFQAIESGWTRRAPGWPVQLRTDGCISPAWYRPRHRDGDALTMRTPHPRSTTIFAGSGPANSLT